MLDTKRLITSPHKVQFLTMPYRKIYRKSSYERACLYDTFYNNSKLIFFFLYILLKKILIIKEMLVGNSVNCKFVCRNKLYTQKIFFPPEIRKIIFLLL